MAINVNNSIQNKSPNADSFYYCKPNSSAPWDSIEDAHAGIPQSYRGNGKKFLVSSGLGQIEYWYQGGIEMANLVPVNTTFLSNKQMGGTIEYLRQAVNIEMDSIYITEGAKSGIFIYDPTDTTTEDDGVMTINSAERRYKRQYDGFVNVKWFDVVGDGIVDDTAGIQAAIDYLNPSGTPVYKFMQSPKQGGTLYFPAGRYRITNTLYLTNSVRILGGGSQSFYSNISGINPTSAVIIGDFATDGFMIQTQSWRIKNTGGTAVTPGRVGAFEQTKWTQFDNSWLSLTHGASVENIALTQIGTKRFGGIRLCGAVSCMVKNVEVDSSYIGIMTDCALANKIQDVHISARVIGLMLSESQVSTSVENAYINSDTKTNWAALGYSVPGYYNFNKDNVIKTELGYDIGSTLATAIFSNGAESLSLNEITIEGWDIGLVNKSGKGVKTGMMYFEGISDTGIVTDRGNTKCDFNRFVNVKTLHGIGQFANVIEDFGVYSNNPVGFALFKGYSESAPGNNSFRGFNNTLTSTSFDTRVKQINEAGLADVQKNNSVVLAFVASGVPFYGSLFTFGGGDTDNYYQAQLLVSTNPADVRTAFRSKGIGGWSAWKEFVTNDGALFTGSVTTQAFLVSTLGIVIGGTGTNAFYQGNGDGANYTTYNFKFHGEYGMAMEDNSGNIMGYYNFRSGKWDVKDGYYINGVKLQSAASANTATVAAGAAPTKAEFDALLTELRDLKTKMRTAGLLAP